MFTNMVKNTDLCSTRSAKRSAGQFCFYHCRSQVWR